LPPLFNYQTFLSNLTKIITLSKENTLDILKAFSLGSFVLGSNSPPKTIIVTPTSLTIATESSTTQAQPEIISNPAYEEWRRSDLLILVWLRQIIYDHILGHLTRASSSYDAWTKIERMFQSQMRARVMQLKSQLQNLSKGNLSILEYFEKKRAIVDSLAESLYFVQDDDFISFILNGLDSSFGIFKVAFNMRSGTITPEELFGLLLQEEERFAKELRSTTINTQFGADPSHALLTHNSSFL
ncbi:hypothetical protein MTR67_008320, partial [Solanum verrucosum]